MNVVLCDFLPLGSVFTFVFILSDIPSTPVHWLLACVGIIAAFVAGALTEVPRPSPRGIAKPPLDAPVQLDRRRTRFHRFAILLVYLMAMLDLGFTLYAYRLVGSEVEWNPIALPFLHEGPAALALLKFVFLALCTGAFHRHPRLLWVIFFLYGAVMGYWAHWLMFP